MGKTMKGLNQAQRAIVRGMVLNGKTGEEVRAAIGRMVGTEEWDYDKNVQFLAELSAAGYTETAMYMERRLHRSEKCWVVTTTFGEGSAEWLQVRRRCPSVFKRNPLFSRAWHLYQFVGPYLANWARSNRFGFRVCQVLLGWPIVKATDSNRIVAFVARLYLALLIPVIAAMSVPVFAWSRMSPWIRSARNGQSHTEEATPNQASEVTARKLSEPGKSKRNIL